MSALPDTGTNRLFVDYNDGQFSHTLKVRYDGGIGDAAGAMDAVDALLTAIADTWYTITIEAARVAAEDSVFSFPVTWSGLASYGSETMPRVFAPRQLLLLGRDFLGRRMRLFLFGYKGTSPDNYRLARVTDNVVDDALDVIEAQQANGYFLAITRNVPTMYQYASFNFNNYYEKQARG